MEVAVEKQFLTLDEYIEFEKRSESKHEYRNGKLFEMAGGKLPHNLIASDILSLIKSGVKAAKKKCHVVGSDQKIYIPLANRGTYGDVTVVCGKAEFHDKSQYLPTNPLLIVEVLSKSTQSYDKGDKFDLYRSLPSFREYVLVAQNEPSVQVRYLKDPEEDLWQYSNATGLEGYVRFQSLDLVLQMKEIYAAIEEFTEEED